MKRLITMVTLGAGLALLTWVVLDVTNVLAGPLDRAIAAWKEAGGAADIPSLMPADPGDDQNAATLYIQATQQMPPFSPAQAELLEDPWPAPVRDLERLVLPYRSQIRMMIEAGKRERCAWPQPFQDRLTRRFAPWDVRLKQLGQLLIAHARVQALEGNVDEAAIAIEATLNLARHIGADPGYVALMRRLDHEENALLAVKRLIITREDVGPNWLSELLAERDYRGMVVNVALAEGTAAVELAVTGKLGEAKGLLGQAEDFAFEYKSPRAMRNDVIAMLEQLTTDIERWRKPYHEQRTAERRIKDKHPLTKMVVGSMDFVNDEVAAVEAQAALALAALEMIEYRTEKKTAPMSPDAAGVSAIDPLTGKAFYYQSQGDGFVLSRAGADGEPMAGTGDELYRWDVP